MKKKTGPLRLMRGPGRWAGALAIAAGAAWAQGAGGEAEIQEGHRLALLICAACHVAAADQPSAPILRPPAAPFASIALRPDVSAASLQTYLTTTHPSLGNAQRMPNPDLVDAQARQLAAYILSLRAKP